MTNRLAKHDASMAESQDNYMKRMRAKQQMKRRNFTKEECSALLDAAGGDTALNGAFSPSITLVIKQTRWKQVARTINAINGVGDRTWRACKRKFQDLMAEARKKHRKILQHRQRTGGGSSRMKPLTGWL